MAKSTNTNKGFLTIKGENGKPIPKNFGIINAKKGQIYGLKIIETVGKSEVCFELVLLK